jgi:hypothetical protein
MRQAIALPRRHVLASRKCFEVGKDKVSFAKLTMHMIPKIYESMRCTCFNCSHADIQIRHRLVRGQSIHNGLEFTLERGNPCYQYSQIHGNVYDCHPITPYHPETLEPLSTASDSSDSDSDDSDSSGLSSDSETALNGEKPTYNYQKDRIPPESHRFPLGSTCKANAQVAHTLYHWRYNLYQWVKDHLKAQGHLSAEKLVKREGKSDRKREKEARKIVDAMEADGQIKSLCQDIDTIYGFCDKMPNAVV